MTRSVVQLGGQVLKLDADADTSIEASSDDVISIKTADGERLTIQADGDTQIIGTTANTLAGGDGQLRIRLAATRSSGVGPFIGFDVPRYTGDANTEDMGAIGFVASDSTNNSRKADFVLHTRNTSRAERMRVDSSGRLLLGTTSPIASSNVVLHINADSIATDAGSLLSECSGTGDVFHIHFRNGNGGVGGIKTNGSTTTYATSSDYRLKENIITDWDATTRLKQLKPSRFNFKADKDTTLDGFVAHEVSSIIPEAINGKKDQTQDLGTIKDKDGNVLQENVLESEKQDGQTWTKTKTENVYQGIDQSKLVPLLTKALQEAISEIDTLKEKVTALESK